MEKTGLMANAASVAQAQSGYAEAIKSFVVSIGTSVWAGWAGALLAAYGIRPIFA